MSLVLRPVEVATEEGEGQLVFSDGKLVAVLTRLSGLHGAMASDWFLEAGFGPLDGSHPTFPDLDAAKAWIAARLAEGRVITPEE